MGPDETTVPAGGPASRRPATRGAVRDRAVYERQDPGPVVELTLRVLTAEAFAPCGTVIEEQDDGGPFGANDAVLHLTDGTPRLYIMRLKHKPPAFHRITRHLGVTQCLASVGGTPWVLAVAPPSDPADADPEPRPGSIMAFAVPGDVAIALHRGTWHAGPFFSTTSASFLNLELSNTNVDDHHTIDLLTRHGVTYAISPDSLRA